ncbi:hypothetical protein GGR42_002908 [Saonia flava]|uniref:3-keto-alpha-glucoside-1,2-lyase/3-keto-2-hydroxy-glucal hydratase domain-containing protein n=1 Tax=Saonia flava TaxID=523696 RepID=A0A846QYY7_9FLAO|nr:DUF1080 domain-containing protein [Saonia flava]NJB72417.1 hypothetical protein [Saonia flava]
MKLTSTTLFIGFILLFNCKTPKNTINTEWETLFNGSNLERWDTYLGPQFKPGRTWDNIREFPALGFNNDTPGVFTVAEIDGKNAIRISGEYWGGISTKKEYENYHLQLKFKWGEKKWYPKENDNRDSGLLYHGVGEQGDGDGFWLRSQELQIQETDCGDYWGVAGAMFDVKTTLNGDTYQYDKNGTLLTFSQDAEIGRHVKKYPDAEKPTGEWNTVDLYCYGGTSIHVINGVVTMILENSRINIDGKISPLTKGKIQLQSEAAEVFYTDIKIRSITELPQL